jgi:F-type H+-transporting ATPase subunit alpha
LERAAKLNDELGGGSITALPLIETLGGELSYIPTNVISITDGQIFLESELFFAGIRPAMNVGISVSRVGGSAQISAMRKIAGKLRINLAQFRELAAFSQFGSELDNETRQILDHGERLQEVLKQPQNSPMNVEEQVVSIYAVNNGYMKDVRVDMIKTFEHELLDFVRLNYKQILDSIVDTKNITEETEEELKKALAEFKAKFVQ